MLNITETKQQPIRTSNLIFFGDKIDKITP
jgi:hypothetical protein